jgi:uroporphyrinogen III methyltransferase/synthase
LLTLKAAHCLSCADVIVYDQLVDLHALDFARPWAEFIYAGKSGARHALEQDQINALLVQKARQGKIVARLKGGDPLVLGRGGEEAEALRRARIPFEIIPGVTSAIAAPAYAGIPVTHRGLASSFAVITGHEDPTKKKSSLKWDKLATGVDTLVFLMGMKNLGQITTQLVKNGRKPDTPVAVIRQGTFPDQVTLTGTLADIAEKVKRQGLEPPAVVVIGDVVKLRDKLRWYDKQPLFGKRVLVTRPSLQAEGMELMLRRRGATPVLHPVIEIKPLTSYRKLDKAIKNVPGYDWLVFTSVNGVESFFYRLEQLGKDSRWLAHASIAVIGPATYRELEKQGITADFMPAKYTSAGFLSEISNNRIINQRFLLPRADIADRELSDGLRELGGLVDEVAVYRTVENRTGPAKKQELLLKSGIDVITFTSSSTVTGLLRGLSEEDIVEIKAKIACIGPKTADAAVSAGLKADIIAPESTVESLVEAIETYFNKET